MDTKEYKFYLCYGAAEFLYKFVIIGFLCFAFFFVYGQLGLTAASALIYLFIVINGSILLFPLICINGKRPLYVIDSTGIKQNKYLFWPRVLPWSHIRSISYPANTLIGGKDAISFDLHTARINHRLVIISLSDIDDPPAFLQAVNNFKPYGYDQLKGGIYFQLHHDREKILYITLLYLCVTISLVLASTFDAPYVWIESNKYSEFWALLFFTHMFFSIVVSFFAYKDIQKRKSIIKAAILFWFFVTLGPFIVEQNV